MPEEKEKQRKNRAGDTRGTITAEDKNVNGTAGGSEGPGRIGAPGEGPDNPHDKGYKRVLKNRRVLLHMLRKYTDFAWARDVREEDIEFEDKEFVTDYFHTYESDLICRIRRGEQEIYLFLLLELQSGMDFTMPFRLLVYMVNLWEQYFRNVPERERERKEFRLPMVVPVVLYNGKESWTATRRFRDYLKDGEAFGEYGVDFQYALIDVRRLAKDLVLNSNSVIDNIFYLDRAREKKEFLCAVEEMMDRVAELPADEKNLLETWFAYALEGMFREEERAFVRECFQKGEKRMISGFQQMMAELEEQAEERGIKLGEALGEERGIRILISSYKEIGFTPEQTSGTVARKYGLPPEKAREYVERYWECADENVT